MPVFSVIIPVYNAAVTLPQTLQSVAQQDYTAYEVVLVDDGSTDESWQVLEATTKTWKNTTLLRQANNGLGNARNTAVHAAQGEWLVFLDADDYWAPHKLRILAQTIKEHPACDLIYHPVYERYENGLLRKRRFWQVANSDEFVNKGNPFVPSAMALKRATYLASGGFIEARNQVEDVLFWFRLLNKNIEMCALTKPLTVYRMGTGVTAKLDDHLQKVKRALAQAVAESEITTAQREVFLLRKHYEAARQLQKLGFFSEAEMHYALVHAKSTKTRLLRFLNRYKISI